MNSRLLAPMIGLLMVLLTGCSSSPHGDYYTVFKHSDERKERRVFCVDWSRGLDPMFDYLPLDEELTIDRGPLFTVMWRGKHKLVHHVTIEGYLDANGNERWHAYIDIYTEQGMLTRSQGLTSQAHTREQCIEQSRESLLQFVPEISKYPA